MATIYTNLLTDKQYKAATGLSKEQFEELFQTFGPLYEPKKPANPYAKTDSRNPVLTDKREALFFILHYLKAYPTLQNLALYFGFSEYAASQYIDRIMPVLKEALNRKTNLKTSVFKNQKEFDRAFSGVDEIYVDVTEVPVERPSDKQVQQSRYSGKKNSIPQSGSS